MSLMSVVKVDALPETLTANTVYLVKIDTTENPNKFITVVTDGDGVPYESISSNDPLSNMKVETIAALRAIPYTPGMKKVETIGCLTVGDGGDGVWRWDATNNEDDNVGLVVKPTGHVGAGRWVRVFSGRVNARWFGFLPSASIANATAALIAALAAMTSGGHLYIPAGTYKSHRGTGSLLADTIVAGNLTISGDGPATIINGNPTTLANNGYNQYYSVFQATSLANITIADMQFIGAATPVYLIGCTNVTIRNIITDGLLANAGSYLRNDTIALQSCRNVQIQNCAFDNYHFAIHTYGSEGSRNAAIRVAGCSFEQSATTFTAPFPLGVYAYYVDDMIVTGCSFTNIYSSVNGGDEGSGMGFGVYEGDGSVNSLTVDGNTFVYNTTKGTKNGYAVFISKALRSIVSNNIFDNDTGRGFRGVYLGALAAGMSCSILGNNLRDCALYVAGTSSGLGLECTIADNTLVGGAFPIYVTAPNATVTIDGNTISDAISATAGWGVPITLNGGATSSAIKFPRITNNRISNCSRSAVILNYVISAYIVGNTILDGNIANESALDGAAVAFKNYSHGCVLRANVIGNTPAGGGKFTYAFGNINSASDRVFKDIIDNVSNICRGLTGSKYSNFWGVEPTNGLFDTDGLDYIAMTSLSPTASSVPGYYCVFQRLPALLSNASSASTTLHVADTTGVLAGDHVLLVKTDPYLGDYAATASWHATTVSSVTDGTHLVLTDAIPVGDGTYVAGTAYVRIVRFRAAAATA